jgi:hypothetical protein
MTEATTAERLAMLRSKVTAATNELQVALDPGLSRPALTPAEKAILAADLELLERVLRDAELALRC